MNNPGGLTAVWAEENTRNAIFTAVKKREVYATSGPTIRVRFFGGRTYPDDLCGQSDSVATGYRQGVPMGGDLPPYPGGDAAPRFAVQAEMDPDYGGKKGTLLQQVQIIKGYIAQGGQPMLKVFEVAGDPANEAEVNEETCEGTWEGFESL